MSLTASVSANKASHSGPELEQPKSRREREIELTRQLLEKSDQLLKEVDESYIFKETEPRKYPTFDRNELKFGPVLGVGGFGIVYEVENIKLKLPSEVQIFQPHSEPVEDDENQRQAVSDHTNELVLEDPTTFPYHHNNHLPLEDLTIDHGESRQQQDQQQQQQQQSARSDESQTAATTAGDDADLVHCGGRLGVGVASRAALMGGTNHDDCHYNMLTARQHMTEHARRNGDARYAVKRLHRDLSDLELARGMIDMAIEAKILSAVWHPNIIKMRGIASGPTLHRDFFIVMDRLYGTLTDKMDQWRKDQYDMKGNFLGMGANKTQIKQLLKERMTVAYDLAAAFYYMHEKKLVYRDIKQENIGFDIRGDVKVFDFGLCKGLSPTLKNAKDASGGYNLTPRTGSVPYMAPEVAECKPYDCKADVFSFSILLWEMLSLRTAYKGYSRREFLERVVRAKERLSLPRSCPPLTKLVIREGWDNEPQRRPDMKRVAALLRGDLNDMTSDPKVRDRTQHLMQRSARSYRMSRDAATRKDGK